ncbi:MAG: hypothetical protein C4296_10275 [Gemmataceae bacterium]|mgnify:CR=1 FL=1
MWHDLWHLITQWVRDNPELLAAFVLGALAVLSFVVVWLWKGGRSHQPIAPVVVTIPMASASESSPNQAMPTSESGQATDRLRWKYKLLVKRYKRSKQTCTQLTEQLERERAARVDEVHELKTQVQQKEQELEALRTRLRILENREGDVFWQSHGLPREPAFVAKWHRKQRIVSFLNFKGGVGKTTIAAFLAAALAEQGRRVLLLDLDYQGSLSDLCVQSLSEVFEKRLLIDNFLTRKQPDAKALLDRATEVHLPGGFAKCSIVASSDDLQQVETRLENRWLRGVETMDVRTILLSALHDPRIGERFEFVFLDCPPRQTLACINALVCSDYALVPTRLDKLSLNGACRVLRTLRMLKSAAPGETRADTYEPPPAQGTLVHPLCPQLELLGLVINFARWYRKQEAKLIRSQEEVKARMPHSTAQAWGEDVHVFSTYIAERDEADRLPLREFNRHDGAEFADAFRALAAQVLERVAQYEGSCAEIVPSCIVSGAPRVR